MTATDTRLIGRSDLPTTGTPSPTQRALLLAAADGPVELTCKTGKTIGACIRRGWLVAGDRLTFVLTDAGLDAAVR